MANTSSYGRILRSSSIMGGALSINYVLSLVRTKVIAVLLGPSGVGILSLYNSIIGSIGMVSALGINNSAVRAIAEASMIDDPAAVAKVAKALKFACWITGLIGWLLAVVLAYPLSGLLFESHAYAAAIAILGVTLLFTARSNGQIALLQGLQRVGDVARFNVASTGANTLISVALYVWLGRSGIVLALIASAIVSLITSWLLTRRIALVPVSMEWIELRTGAQRLVGLGLAFMWNTVLVAALDIFTRTLITRTYGLGAAGIYQAAWSLSGMFAGFVLTAMGTDFYPRLTAVIQDEPRAVSLVNEQTEIGVLLALPGLVATQVFAPLAIQLFYTEHFLPGAALLPWFVLGIFGRVLSWPMGYIMLAKSASRWFATTETISVTVQALLTFGLVSRFGIIGAAYSFAGAYFLYTLGMLWVGRRLIGFSWSKETVRLLLRALGLVLLTLATKFLGPGYICMTMGGVITVIAVLFSLNGLVVRLGSESRLATLVAAVPGGRWLMRL
jgi:PST family polysaccharide transporter